MTERMSMTEKNRKLLLLALGLGVVALVLVVAVTPVGDALFGTDQAADSSDSESAAQEGSVSEGPTGTVEVTEGGDLAPSGSAAVADDDPVAAGVAGEEEVPVASKGDPLPELEVAPPDTIAMLDPSVAQAGSTYAVTFETYGTTNEPDSLVVFVSSSSALGGGPGFDFENTNVLVYVQDDTLPDTGGTYEGTLTLVDEGGLLVIHLAGIE